MKIIKILMIALCSIIAACSTNKEIPEGERISVLQGKNVIQPDFENDEVKISLPRPTVNLEWLQRGGNSEHAMHHLMSSRNLEEVWTAKFGKGDSKRDFLIAEPVVFSNTVFTIDADAVVSAFKLNSGRRLWKKRLKPMNKDDKSIALKGAGIAAQDNVLYATTGFGSVYALDMMNEGKVIWRYNTDTPIRISPTVGKDRVFVQTIDNVVIAINAHNGQEIWKQKTSSEATTLVGGASAAYDEDLDVVIVAFTSGELRAFKASTGSPLWSDYLVSKRRNNSLANINAIKANPVISDGLVFAAGNNSIFVALDIRTGARVWEKEIGMSNQPWVAGRYIFALSDNSDLFAVEKSTGKIVWSINIPLATNIEEKVGTFVTGPVLTNNRLIVATSSGYAFAVSPYVGKILGFITMDEGVALPPIVADETVIFTSNDAKLLAYK